MIEKTIFAFAVIVLLFWIMLWFFDIMFGF
jgi:hypothetical protein